MNDQSVAYYGIRGYQPAWLTGRNVIERVHGRRLTALAGRRLVSVQVAWDCDDDERFGECPVLVDFDGEQVEVHHQKFADLSVTWNTIDPVTQPVWSDGDDEDPDSLVFHLAWRRDAIPSVAMIEGQRLVAVELLEWVGGYRDAAHGMVAVSFLFPGYRRLTISNGMDENLVEVETPSTAFFRHPVYPTPRPTRIGSSDSPFGATACRRSGRRWETAAQSVASLQGRCSP